MPKTARILITAALLLAVACGQGRNAKSIAPREVTIPAGAGTLAATLYPSLDPHPAGLLLLHGAKGHRDDWILFATRAQQAGFVALAPEFAWPMDASGKIDPSALDRIQAAFDYFQQVGIEPKRIALVGADVGASLALQYGAGNTAVSAVALISPGLDFGGISAEKALAEYGRGAAYFVSASGDAFSADSARTLQAKAAGFSELREYPGAAHGTDLFTVSENSVAQLLDWLKTVLQTPKDTASPTDAR